jgi:hypothetical protein
LVAALALALPLSIAGCSSSDDSKSSAPTTRAPEEITVDAAKVTAGLTAMQTLFADAASAVGTGAAAASTFPDKLENEWKQIEGTIKKNEPDVYVDVEDSMSAMDDAIKNKKAGDATAAATKFSAAADAYLAKHP